MIREILKTFDSKITELSFISRYGGLVETFEESNEVREGIYRKIRYPISKLTENLKCGQSGYYSDMHPDTNEACIVYLEDRSGLKFVRSTGTKGKISEFTADFRLVCWMNGEKLFVEEPHEISSVLASNFINKIKSVKSKPLYPMQVLTARYEVMGMPITDRNTVFDRYTYELQQAPFLEPHKYFAINIRLHLRILTNCIKDVPIWNVNLCDRDALNKYVEFDYIADYFE